MKQIKSDYQQPVLKEFAMRSSSPLCDSYMGNQLKDYGEGDEI